MDIFFDIALFYSSVALVLLPGVGCTFISCEPVDGSISISSIIKAGPLATAYAFFGGIFLLSILYFQTHRHNAMRYFLAIAGGKLLSVPLIIPLQSVHSNWYHIGFACAGFAVEFLFALMVLYECYCPSKQAKGTTKLMLATLVYFAALVVGGITFMTGVSKPFVMYTLVFCEYAIGFSIVIIAKTMHKYSL
jgi:hypothetical protein